MPKIARWLLGAALALGVSAPGWARPPMWIVRDGDSEMLLFGSVHLLPPGLHWRPPAVDRALARADDVWFETPMDQAGRDAAARVAAQAGVLPPNGSLFTLLPTEDGARLLRLAEAYHLDKQGLGRLEPWLAEVALTTAAYQRAGASDADGVDQVLWAAAPATAVKRAFETPEQQIAVLDQAPMRDQIASLSQTARELEADPGQYREVVDAWLAGDLPRVERQAFEPLRHTSPALFARLVTDRNARWAKALDTRLKGKGRTVVVVGVGHLVGREGLPARLRALGYSVSGP
jgi:uncharacterized protein YbaP (TraB family)